MQRATVVFSGLLVVAAGATALSAAPALVPIVDNERVVHVVGTPFQHVYYGHPLETHLLLRFAHRGLVFRRVVVSNEHLEGFASRLDAEVLVHKPTLVVFQAGFDDLLCRAQSAYAPKLHFGWYANGLEAIVRKLRARGVKVVVCSVPPWDNGSTRDHLVFPMDGMQGMVDAARQISARHQAAFADLFTEAIGWPGIGNNAQSKYFYSPAEHQRSWQLLSGQVAFAFDGCSTEIDARTLRVQAAGASVEDLRQHSGAINFTWRNHAGAGPAIIRLNGLKAPKYRVQAGAKPVAVRTAAELAAGLDLGPHLKTKAGSREFTEELARGHAALLALRAIEDYRLPGWARLADFDEQKRAAAGKGLDALVAHDAAVRNLVAPERLEVCLEPDR